MKQENKIISAVGLLTAFALSFILTGGCHFKTGESDNTDANGFGPVVFNMSSSNAFEVSVWGRTYRYRDSVFPV